MLTTPQLLAIHECLCQATPGLGIEPMRSAEYTPEEIQGLAQIIRAEINFRSKSNASWLRRDAILGQPSISAADELELAQIAETMEALSADRPNQFVQ